MSEPFFLSLLGVLDDPEWGPLVRATCLCGAALCFRPGEEKTCHCGRAWLANITIERTNPRTGIVRNCGR